FRAKFSALVYWPGEFFTQKVIIRHSTRFCEIAGAGRAAAVTAAVVAAPLRKSRRFISFLPKQGWVTDNKKDAGTEAVVTPVRRSGSVISIPMSASARRPSAPYGVVYWPVGAWESVLQHRSCLWQIRVTDSVGLTGGI